VSAREPSLEPSGDAVKEPKAGSKGGGKPTGFGRLFEGWELGGVVTALVLSAALLVVPRAAEPGVFPVPLLDVAEARATRKSYDELADQAERQGLPFETRAVGDAVRRLGSVLAKGSGSAEHENRVLRERIELALRAGQTEQLVQLRAVQARLFVRAVRSHSFAGPPGSELSALGGDFAARALRSGWAGPAGCIASDDELLTLFALRWLELTQLRGVSQLKPTLGELRRYYRFLLLHPEGAAGVDGPRRRALARLRYVAALEKRDTEYPADLARGALLAALGMAEPSVEALSTHLGRSTGSVWTLRARNYLLAVAADADAAAEP
jgi:hypothetical protein